MPLRRALTRHLGRRTPVLVAATATVALVALIVLAINRGDAPRALFFALESESQGTARRLSSAEVPAVRIVIFSNARSDELSWNVDGKGVPSGDSDIATPTTTSRGPSLSLNSARLGAGTHYVTAEYAHSDGSTGLIASRFRITPGFRDLVMLPLSTPTASAPSPEGNPSTPTAEPTGSAAPPSAAPRSKPAAALGSAAPPSAAPPSAAPRSKPAAAPTASPPVVVAPASGWPNSSTTGPRAGHALTPSADVVVTKAGAVISDLDVGGCIDVMAPNVTINDVRIDCTRATPAIRVYDGASVTANYVEIDGNGVVGAAVGYSDYTLSHADIHDVIDGPRINSNVKILDSYIHDLARTSNSHNDALQTTGGTGIVIRGNNLQAYNATFDDPMNACFMVGSENAPLRDVVVEHNLLNGGNYSILARDDLVGSNIVIRNNYFGRNFRYGPYHAVGPMTADASNVWADTLTSIF